MLAKQTGLTRNQASNHGRRPNTNNNMTIILPSASIVSNIHEDKFAVPLLIKLDEQVSNWFINARVRLWKPMVEEIHNLEMRQLHKTTSVDQNQLGMQQQNHHSSDGSGRPSSDPSNSQRGQSSGMTRNLSSRAPRHIQDDELSQMPHDMAGQVSFAYSGLPPAHHGLALSHHHHPQQAQAEAVGVGGVAASSGGGVSLTLGLHQNNNNNRAYIAEPLPAALPLSLPHRFGLEDVSDAYVMGPFGGQDRHFSKGIGGGHNLLHDFVG
jgi:hypothetical protein